MYKVFLITRWEYLTRIRSKWFLISTLIIPLVMIAFIFLPTMVFRDSGAEMKIIGLIDNTGILQDEFEAILTQSYHLENGQPKYQIIPLRVRSGEDPISLGREMLDSLEIDALMVLPVDLIDSNRAEYYANFIGNYREQNELILALNTVLMNVRTRAAGLDPELVKNITKQVNLNIIETDRRTDQQTGEIMSYLLPIIFVMMLYFAIVMSSQVLMRSVLEERTNRLVEIILSSVSSTQLMSGKILGLGLLGLTQLTFYIICGLAVSSYRGINIISTLNVLYFFLYFGLGYLFFSAIYASIGAIFSSEQDAQQAVSIISIISVLPLLLSSYVVAHPDSIPTIILSHIPFLSPFFMIMITGIGAPPFWHIITTCIVLIISAILAMLIAGKIFRTAILMTGKRPTLPEILQWIKSA